MNWAKSFLYGSPADGAAERGSGSGAADDIEIVETLVTASDVELFVFDTDANEFRVVQSDDATATGGGATSAAPAQRRRTARLVRISDEKQVCLAVDEFIWPLKEMMDTRMGKKRKNKAAFVFYLKDYY